MVGEEEGKVLLEAAAIERIGSVVAAHLQQLCDIRRLYVHQLYGRYGGE